MQKKELIEKLVRHLECEISTKEDNLENWNNPEYYTIPMPEAVKVAQRRRISEFTEMIGFLKMIEVKE